MTAAVYRSVTPSLSVPQTQNTAPVLEFNCLYTHDLRRKQKRWQDGFLRFHTFNKRIMVYDIPRNFIGDAHWKTSDVLQDGDEVTLEKGGVLVQVAENVGRTETDLTELMNSKKNKKASHQVSSPIARSAVATARTPAPAGSRLTAQSKHRSLNALLGTPKGPLGKATLPSQSPFDQRRVEQENLDWEDGRSAKRLRIEQPAWTVSRTTKAAGAQRAIKPPPLWARTNDAHSKKRIQSAPIRGQQQLGTKEIIDLREDDDGPGSDQFLAGFSSDALVMPSSPPRPPAKERPTVEPLRQIVRSSSPAFRTQQPSVNADTHRREARLLDRKNVRCDGKANTSHEAIWNAACHATGSLGA